MGSRHEGAIVPNLSLEVREMYAWAILKCGHVCGRWGDEPTKYQCCHCDYMTYKGVGWPGYARNLSGSGLDGPACPICQWRHAHVK